ncbi:hypothetical protein CR513_51954, partial [Mucuna pruriens]
MKDKWNVHELHSIFVQEETRLTDQGSHLAHCISHRGNQRDGKKFVKKHDKGKEPLKINETSNKASKCKNCHFYGKSGYFQKGCPRRKAWFKKKSKLNAFVCFKSNLNKVPHNTWWIDFGCTTYVSNTMQRFLIIQTISPNEKFVSMGNRVKASAKAVKTYHLILNIGHHLYLLETLYVPMNLVSLSKLDVTRYSFNSGNGCVLGHISRERMEKLVNNKILPNLDFTYLNICVDCIRGKQTKYTKKKAIRSTCLLEIVHLDVCGPFDVNSFRKERYFITFIDDYSCYYYVYLLHKKSQAVNTLEIYLNEVERQLDKKMKVVRFGRGDEYYGRYNETRKHPSPFTKLL